MFGLKSSTKAVQAPAAPQVEAAATAWGFTPTAWLNLTEAQRRDYRDRVVYAPKLHTVSA